MGSPRKPFPWHYYNHKFCSCALIATWTSTVGKAQQHYCYYETFYSLLNRPVTEDYFAKILPSLFHQVVSWVIDFRCIVHSKPLQIIGKCSCIRSLPLFLFCLNSIYAARSILLIIGHRQFVSTIAWRNLLEDGAFDLTVGPVLNCLIVRKAQSKIK